MRRVRDMKESKPKEDKMKAKYGWKIGTRYYVQTVTHYYVGTLVALTPQELVLVDVAWVADSGRHGEFVAGGAAKEMEAWPPRAQVIVGRGSLVAASMDAHEARTI